MLSVIGDAAVSFVISLLSGMGVGSAGLLVVWLTEVDGVAQVTAQGINLIFFIFSASAAALKYIRRPTLDRQSIFILIPTAIAGAIFGSLAVGSLDPTLLRRIFGVGLVLVGSVTLLRTFMPHRRRADAKKRKI